ncbi:uncharacterized protein LOC130722964 [Lotus japonicus]|uniref:uncharacterized protein LOC130722964 n=1 Tax=Lotus japonicus TaxID=34305 RepID=UPI002587EAAC|nr:uncharacterized protein LOC130722964 [Lotus japonicus]
MSQPSGKSKIKVTKTKHNVCVIGLESGSSQPFKPVDIEDVPSDEIEDIIHDVVADVDKEVNSSPDVEPDVETSAPANEDHDESHHRFGSDQDQDDGNDPNVLTPPRQDIAPSEKKLFAGKRIPQNVPAAPLDNVSFHSESNVLKWNYVFQRRVVKEREVGSDVLECKEVMALIENAGLMKTVLHIGRSYERLLKEFIVNLSVEVGLPTSPEFQKVYVWGKCVKFSPAVINKALGRSVSLVMAPEPSLDEYVILNRIGVINWVPSQHTSGISAHLAKLIYKIGTRADFDFESFVFEQTLKHGETCAVKLPISFLSLLTEIILKQYPKILRDDEVEISKGTPITMDHRLFTGSHVPDIAVPTGRISASASASGVQSGKGAIIAELEEVSKALQDTIRISTGRKLKVDELLQRLKDEETQEGKQSATAAANVEVSIDEEEGSEEDTGTDSSSEEEDED